MAGARVDSKNIDAWATPPRISMEEASSFM